MCKKLTTWQENPSKPFCSERCKLLDLGKWASEEYRIEGKQEEVEDEGQEEKESIKDDR
ncbi:MAG TPA: DNA gyrase inhibitor YacG [Thermodesulfovibrionales bacterium]|nr:DNA gyrase inhibitor YacG [Thermodesulfovibrionales bacterium]